jgi:hypothetical protein
MAILGFAALELQTESALGDLGISNSDGALKAAS